MRRERERGAEPSRSDIDWADVRAEAWDRFGVRRFRRGQRELLEAALSGRDAIGVMPTGSGKSLCFQVMREYLGEERGEPCGRCDNCRRRPAVVEEVLRVEAEAEARPGRSSPDGP